VKQTIRKAIARSTADYTEVRVERRWLNRVLFQRETLETLETASEVGGIVRCLKDGGWGIAVFNDLSQLQESIGEAVRLAAVVAARTKEPVVLADVPVVEDEIRVELEHDFRTVPLRTKVELAQAYNMIILGESNSIVASHVQYLDQFRETTYANSEGTYIVQELPDITCILGAAAGDGKGRVEQGMEYIGEAGGFEHTAHLEGKARLAAQRAEALLDAKPVSAGTHTVVLDPMLAGVFIHEAFGHFCEADFLFKNPRLAEIMALGGKFGSDDLNVSDAGYMPGARGNVPYDDEGVLRQTVPLIRNGCLQGLLHSRETASVMADTPTGNARSVSYEHEPIVRMRNTFIENGDVAFDDMIREVDKGIYALGAYGGQTELEQFSFSSAYAYEIVEGQIGGMLRNVVLSGNVFETLRSIDAIGNDLRIEGGPGGCGKAGQNPLPVTTGAPHIRIRNVTIGGQ